MIKNKTNIKILKMNTKGELQNAYSPLLNLISTKLLLGDFSTKNLQFNQYTPVDMLITDEYDGSTNIILNDDINSPKLINSRFSILENNTFNIPFRSGNNILNIYNDETFKIDSLLLKLYNKIPKLDFKGISTGGSFKCGSYIFYFKLADADGNLTNIILESGIVKIHIGDVNSKKIRMGLQDENSQKSIEFFLSNFDEGFDYVKVFYERISTDESQANVPTYFMIELNYPIKNNKCEILLTGSENIILIAKADIQNEFADILTVKTQAIVDNILFLGNISSYELNYKELQQIAWKIYPKIITDKNIGSINSIDYSFYNSAVYYNMNNVYDATGYWPDELYRFGVVFIYDNNLLSPVFNIQGCDLNNEIKPEDLFNISGEKRLSEPDNYFFTNDSKMMNSKGIIRFPKHNSFKQESSGFLAPLPLGIKFDLQYTNIKNISTNTLEKDNETVYEMFKRLNVKGLFFVRLKRIPTIIAQGLVIGLTGRYNGRIPVILNNNQQYITKSFLSSSRSLLPIGSTVNITSDVETKALIVPDYEIDSATLNLIFTGQEFQLTKLGHIELKSQTLSDYFYTKNILYDAENKIVDNVKLTAVPKGTKTLTDGETYFSTRAGNPDEAYKTEDVNLIWNKTKPQDLTVSTSLIRGEWGSFVGMNKSDFDYGDIVNIKLKDWENLNNLKLEFSKRFKDFSLYSAICDRVDIRDLFDTTDSTKWNIKCYRGDCFQNIFTHRMMNNFIDPELPTNTLIVDPSCWASNYGIRCTAEILQDAHSNLTSDSNGWYIPSPVENDSVVSMIFAILTGNIGLLATKAAKLAQLKNQSPEQLEYANEIVLAFEVYVGDNSTPGTTSNDIVNSNMDIETLVKDGHIKKVNPKEQELRGGFNLKAIFKSDDKWELHGLSAINRADVNAVSFGQWISFPICSKYNLALRDIDFTKATEESTMNKKRSFYPLEEIDVYNHLPESEYINGAAKVSISNNQHTCYQTIPYIKQEFFNRIYWSKPNVTEQFINSYRMIFKDQYREYNKEFGSITKLVSLENYLLVVFQHGLGILPVNKTPLTEQDTNPYLSSKNILPSQLLTISSDYGSMWKDSILKSPYSNIVYGVDTVAKKIWRLKGLGIEFISDFKVQKFLNDHINLSEYDFKEYQGHINVKTHYNEFKHDVIFTYYKDIPVDINGNKVDVNSSNFDHWEKGERWSLCFNEIINNFITFYSWFPVESCNIDNIFFSFDKELIDTTIKNNNNNNIIQLSYPKLIKIKSKDEYNISSYLQQNGELYRDLESYKLYSISKKEINGDVIDPETNEIVGYIEEPIVYLKSIDYNKYFIDKAFTYNTTVYYWDREETLTIKDIPDNSTYLSFYYKNLNNSNINLFIGTLLIDLSNYSQKLVNLQNNWNFVVIPLDKNNIEDINFYKHDSELVQLTEFKFTKNLTIADLDVTDSNLGFMKLRESELNKMYLWKHGQAGLYDNEGVIKPTHWYGKLHEWAFEFIINESPNILKIFNNLFILSNKAAPYKFEYEVIGEAYEWYIYKEIIGWINKHKDDFTGGLDEAYKYVLSNTYGYLINNSIDFPKLFNFDKSKKISKLPYLKLELTDEDGLYYENPDYWENKSGNYTLNTSETILREDSQLSEFKIHTESKANDVKKYGRLRGNMEYLEDLWKIEIRPINFRYAFIKDDLLVFTDRIYETRHRDKFIRIKIRYTGEELAIIQGVFTLFDLSYA